MPEIRVWWLKLLLCVQRYWHGDSKWRYVPVREMADQFAQSHWGRAQAEAVSAPFEESELSNSALVYKPFALDGECGLLPGPSFT